MRIAVTLMVLGLVLGSVAPVLAVETQTLADFDMPPPNNVGGAFGAFSPKAEEMTYVTIETWDEAIKHGSDGGSMKLEYNVDKPGAFNGFWMKFGPEDVGNNFDASEYTTLSFWVKGDTAAGVPAKVKIELKGDPGTRIGRAYVKEITDDWKKIEIPLKNFASQRVDVSKLNEFVIVFEQMQAAPGTKGTIWIDNIALEP